MTVKRFDALKISGSKMARDVQLCVSARDYDILMGRCAELEAEVRQLGEIGNVCTYSTLKTVCSYCRCGKQQATPDGGRS